MKLMNSAVCVIAFNAINHMMEHELYAEVRYYGSYCSMRAYYILLSIESTSDYTDTGILYKHLVQHYPHTAYTHVIAHQEERQRKYSSNRTRNR